jgi:cyclase
MLEGCDLLEKLAGPDTTLIPGHGQIIKRGRIAPYKQMIIGVRDRVQQMIEQGKTEKEVLAAKVTVPYDAKVPGGNFTVGAGQTSAERFVSEVFQELKGGAK